MLINSLIAGVKTILGHSTMKALQEFIVTSRIKPWTTLNCFLGNLDSNNEKTHKQILWRAQKYTRRFASLHDFMKEQVISFHV